MQPEGRSECSPGLKAFLSLPQPGPWSKQGSENEATSPRTRRDGSHQSNQRLLGIKDGLGHVRVCVHACVCICVRVYGSWPISEGLGICAVLGWTEQRSFCGEVTFPWSHASPANPLLSGGGYFCNTQGSLPLQFPPP